MTHRLTLTASSAALTAALLLGAPAEAAEMTFDRATHIRLGRPGSGTRGHVARG